MTSPYPFPMTPAQSWLLVVMAMASAVLLAYLFYYADILFSLAARNVKVVGIKGIWLALRGKECFEIKREVVTSVLKRDDDGYTVLTSDGEFDFEYTVMPTQTDDKNPKYWEALNLARDNEELKSVLLPNSRVLAFYSLHDSKTDTDFDVFVIYVKDEAITGIESALNEFFEQEYRDEVAEARKNKTLVA